MPLAAGTRLGPYEILGPLGAGGMGEVYQARDTRLDRTVAIKIMPDALAADPHFRDRFEREARTISQLDHPNICALYDVGQERGTSYLVMQYLEGETLATRLVSGPLPLSDALRVAIEIAGALTRAHKAGVVHRDLKPGNVMLTRSGSKLLDFGLAKTQVAAGSVSVMPTTPAAITAPGAILGTFQYMAPEQLEGQDADTRTDIFAFGALLYEMVTGHPAFQGKTQASLAGAILRDDPTTTPHAVAALPAPLARVIRTCLAKDPDERFQTVQDLALQLQWLREAATTQIDGPAIPAGSGVSSVVTPSSGVTPASGVAAASGVAVAAPATPRPRDVDSLERHGCGDARGGRRSAAVALTRPAPPPPRMVRFEVNNPEGAISIGAPRVSPDGRYLAFNATDASGVTKIWVRQMNALDRAAATRHRRREPALLVARQQVPRLHGAGKADEDRCVGRTGAEDLRRAERIGWQLEPGRGHPVRRPRQRSDLPRAGVGWNAGAGGETQRRRQGSDRRMARVPPRRTPLHIPRAEREARGQHVSHRPAGFRRVAAVLVRARPCSRMRRPATCCSCAIRRWWRSRSTQRQ